MIGPIIERCYDIDHRVTGNNAILQCLSNSIFDMFDIFFRNCPANHSVDKFKTFTALVGSNTNPDVSVLPMTACLPDMLALSLGFPSDRLTISNLGTPHVCLYPKFAEQAIHNHFQMQFTHTIDNGLTAFWVGPHLESRVLFCQFS